MRTVDTVHCNPIITFVKQRDYSVSSVHMNLEAFHIDSEIANT